MPPDRFVLGVAGRLSVEKGMDRAVRSLAVLVPDHPHVELPLVGDGPRRGELDALARGLGIRRGVRFHGWKNRSHALCEMTDALLLPSRTEGLPNAVLKPWP